MRRPRVLVIGTHAGGPPPGLPEASSGADYVFADDLTEVRAHLPACDVVFHYGEPRDALRASWDMTDRLCWIHAGTAGVDWALFPELVESQVQLTNSRGVFDTTLSEYVLALMLALVKDVPETVRSQLERRWHHRPLTALAGGRALLLGAGTIGQATGRLLRSMGLQVTLVGRAERDGGRDEGRVRSVADLDELLAAADWLVITAPLTAATRGLVGAAQLARMPYGARLVNAGRGAIVQEGALIDALRSGHIAGAALDVFEQEPLPTESPLWSMPQVIVSPHIGGDVPTTPAALTEAFLANLGCYIRGEPLHGVVDKHLGYVPADPPRVQETSH